LLLSLLFTLIPVEYIAEFRLVFVVTWTGNFIRQFTRL